MLFNSLTFAVFFSATLALYYLLRRWSHQKSLLLAASYIFYAAWNPPFVLLLWLSSTMDWWLARRIMASDEASARRKWLAVSVVVNLGLLGYFKYGAFAMANFAALMAALGIAWQPPAWDIVLPVGISFYTFQSLSYTIDCYRRRGAASTGYRDFLLFVSFFPQLVAGPIVRAGTFLPQLELPRAASRNQFGWGLALLVFGLFQKVVLADGIFAPAVDQVYSDPAAHGAIDTWAAVLGFAGQIYYDFAGYSLCAIGAALCLGFDLPDNFAYPYGAQGITDFWRRWHISLSTWLRDYLYIPLGGNRGSELATYGNLMLTMLIGGLWHGASWMYVLWGGLHGSYLALERFLRSRLGVDVSRPRTRLGGSITAVFTFLVVALTWIPFRAADAESAHAVLANLGRLSVPTQIDVGRLFFVGSAAILTVLWHCRMRMRTLEDWFGNGRGVWQSVALGLALCAVFLMSGGDQRAFIYFQF